MNLSIAVLPGDGVGVEVTRSAVRVLQEVVRRHDHFLNTTEGLIGGAAIDVRGDPLPPETVALAMHSDAVLLGAVGGPRWGASAVRPEAGLLRLRRVLGTFANLRPVAVLPALAALSPLRAERLVGVDLLFVRELTGGLYFGAQHRDFAGPEDGARATDTCVYTEAEIARVIRLAGWLARERRQHVTSVDKANVLETSRLWRETTTRIMRDEFPDVALEHVLVDSFAMLLMQQPARYDVVVTENLFGDILTDEAAVLVGSIGLLPSASLGARRADGTVPGLYEPIHGSAPDLAGQQKANPVGAILSAALMLRHSFGLESAAADVESAVWGALLSGSRTADCALEGERSLGTDAFTDAVLARLP